MLSFEGDYNEGAHERILNRLAKQTGNSFPVTSNVETFEMPPSHYRKQRKILVIGVLSQYLSTGIFPYRKLHIMFEAV